MSSCVNNKVSNKAYDNRPLDRQSFRPNSSNDGEIATVPFVRVVIISPVAVEGSSDGSPVDAYERITTQNTLTSSERGPAPAELNACTTIEYNPLICPNCNNGSGGRHLIFNEFDDNGSTLTSFGGPPGISSVVLNVTD
ncbi:hypothetical protein DERP_006666 [Dermatophagoides pteronyssinus]|uniref:Uncharacterized protein n=1 Tax=Dermatophagoides pteronyssinus TaxID=6956 RepID=A0ABQ8IQU9_DERPT|nr:hypothetical protein DERP_006666 [Dermatophagoides pteronyssinus]